MRKILIVDDDPEILSLVQDYLELRKISVTALSEGRYFIETAIRLEPDLIMLDIALPDGDGINLLKTLKSNPLTAFIPVIMLTGQSSPEIQVDGLVSGADDYVTKPFDLNILYARVISVLRRSLKQTRSKYDQMNLLRYLINRYTKRDYTIYTKMLTEYPDHPDYWCGFQPDLIVKKGNKYRCYNFETSQSILEESFIERLKLMAEIPNQWKKPIEVNIVVRTKENEKIVRRIIDEKDIPIQIKLIKHRSSKK